MMDKKDALLFVGLTMMAAGCWMIYPPAALIVPGIVLAGIAIFGVP